MGADNSSMSNNHLACVNGAEEKQNGISRKEQLLGGGEEGRVISRGDLRAKVMRESETPKSPLRRSDPLLSIPE